jgi:uncharacterized protein DUF4157
MQERDLDSTQDHAISRAKAPEEDRDKDRLGPGVPAQRSPLDRVTCREGDQSCAGAHAAALGGSPPGVHRASLLKLQRQFGNRYVHRVLSISRAAGHEGEGADLEQKIQRERGAGQMLDYSVKRQMESAFQADFGNVRVHNDPRANDLSRNVDARAFTTGNDIFFGRGEYNPGSSAGRELIAHELTHVVQQEGPAVKPKLDVSQPGDSSELEADQVARAVMQEEQRSVQRAASPQEAGVQRQAEMPHPEEDEEKKKQPLG